MNNSSSSQNPSHFSHHPQNSHTNNNNNGNHHHHQHQLYSSAAAAALSSYNNQSVAGFPPLSLPAMNNVLRGYGRLTWLSSKAGLITCSKPILNATVSFQLKDFCDQVFVNNNLFLHT
jgi:hypothetical protein